jgi:hypothetical protein
MKILLLLLLSLAIQTLANDVEISVKLTPRMAYDCKTDGHHLLMRESAFDGIPLTKGSIVLDYYMPKGTIWSDIKFRTENHVLYITIPLSSPPYYAIQTIKDGILI